MVEGKTFRGRLLSAAWSTWSATACTGSMNGVPSLVEDGDGSCVSGELCCWTCCCCCCGLLAMDNEASLCCRSIK